MQSGDFVVVMVKRKPRVKTLTDEERTVLYVVLVIWIGSFIMMIYSSIQGIDSAVWQIIFSSILSAMGGFTVGSNRRK